MFGNGFTRASIHQREAASPISIFREAGVVAGLAKQRGLLVSRDACNRDLGAKMTCDRCPHDLARRHDLRKHRFGNSENIEQTGIPLTRSQIHQHGARGIGNIRDMHRAFGQLPDQPAIYGAKE